jgi:lipid A ethanolaminephosphotransferase
LITRAYINLAEAERVVGLAAFADNIVAFYPGSVLFAMLAAVLGLVAVQMPPHVRSLGVAHRLTAMLLAPLLPVGAMTGVLYKRGGDGTEGLPEQFKAPAFAVALGLERALSGGRPQRRDVAIVASREPAARHVVVLMDESIRGDLLDINRPGGAYSGLLRHRAVAANFGVASSIANCSAATNAGFRYGVTRRNHLEELRVNPSIWRYARKAGFRTVYIDGQRHGGGLMNLMTAEEAADIDVFLQLPRETRPFERDLEIARRLKGLLGAERSFIFVNKMGAHFPYEGKYPPESARFMPVMKQTYFGSEVDPASERGWMFRPDPGESDIHTRFRNSYLNAVEWNVGRFFDTLLDGIDLSQTVLVYTADHGQDLHEDRSPGFNTHCSRHGPLTEGMVPLVILTGIEPVLREMREAARRNHNAATQFNLFPSVLQLLGYEREDVGRFASAELPLLADLRSTEQRFFTQFFVRLGAEPAWSATPLQFKDPEPAVARPDPDRVL